MEEKTFSPQVLDLLAQLQNKYNKSGQDMASYLEGLLYTEYLSYWDYIRLDTLLSLQAPRTDFPDEMVFIMYHQITELYLKLSIHEIEQICHNADLSPEFFIARMKRINRYMGNLIDSFDTMVDGMEVKQFLKFRMSLLPASGFQSGQFRMMELMSTDAVLLTKNSENANLSITECLDNLYWREGATELATGSKTLTLVQFEQKYMKTFLETAERFKDCNLRKLLNRPGMKENAALVTTLREFDLKLNVQWKLMHYKSAVRYLDRSPDIIAATGGTNWQKYLPPRFQKRTFFPELWTAEELENWGKQWVIDTLSEQQNKAK